MNHISHTINPILSSNVNSPTCDKILSPENEISPPITLHCRSWKSRLFAKVKECRNAIKNIMAFEKPSDMTEGIQNSNQGNSHSTVHSKTSRSSLSSIISYSNIRWKTKSNDKEILMRYSTLNVEDEESSNASLDQANNTNDTQNYFIPDRTNSSSLMSFIALEQQIKQEFVEDVVSASFKKKISAEPFLPYTEDLEFAWMDDAEGNFSTNASNSIERLNLSDLDFENPCTHSTFCEQSVDETCSSSNVSNCALKDSGFENNISI